jgi:hypothetical protein
MASGGLSTDSRGLKSRAALGGTVDRFGEWKTAFKPVLEAFLGALSQCDSTCDRRWAPALLSDADQLRAASRTIRRWSSGHPCPHVDFDGALARLARSYAYAAISLETVAKGSSATWLVADHELKALHRSVSKVIAMLYEESQNQVDVDTVLEQ